MSRKSKRRKIEFVPPSVADKCDEQNVDQKQRFNCLKDR